MQNLWNLEIPSIFGFYFVLKKFEKQILERPGAYPQKIWDLINFGIIFLKKKLWNMSTDRVHGKQSTGLQDRESPGTVDSPIYGSD
jgi:hypothetical protein